MFIVCADHIERAIDDFVDMTGEPPELLTIEQAELPPGTNTAKCNFCHAVPQYVVVRPKPAESSEDEEPQA